MSNEPESNSAPDRSILPPILLGGFSLFGILLVFVIGNMSSGRNAVPVEETATPFKYQLIGTEPGISTAELITGEPISSEYPSGNGNGSSSGPLGLVVTAQQGGSSGSGSDTSSGSNPTKAKTSTSSYVVPTTDGSATQPIIILNPGTRTATSSFGIIVRTAIPTNTPRPTVTLTLTRTKSATTTAGSSITNTPTIPASGPTQVPLAPGTYDDSHPLIGYSGWTSITDSSAYQSTLHISNIAGSTITFRFIGQQIHLKFQGSASYGVIQINIGGLIFDLDESAGTTGTNEWISVLLAQGTYIVTITHTGGGSVNLDAIVIPDLNTPTPTLTSAP